MFFVFQQAAVLVGFTYTCIMCEYSKTGKICRKNYERGKLACGWTIEPPAANEYAVLPEVVDKINPSPCTHVTKELSQ